jgi:hypothetical protein
MADQSRDASPSIRKHKRDLAWQIILPIILAGVVIIAGAIFISFGRIASTSLWRDISLIWILFPALFIALVAIVIVGAAIYGMARLAKAAPRFTSRAQELTLKGAHGIQKIANGTAKPFIWLGQAGAAVRAIFKR